MLKTFVLTIATPELQIFFSNLNNYVNDPHSADVLYCVLHFGFAENARYSQVTVDFHFYQFFVTLCYFLITGRVERRTLPQIDQTQEHIELQGYSAGKREKRGTL